MRAGQGAGRRARPSAAHPAAAEESGRLAPQLRQDHRAGDEQRAAHRRGGARSQAFACGCGALKSDRRPYDKP